MERADARRYGFHAAYFLDAEMFQRSEVGTPQIDLPLSKQLLDSTRDVQKIVSRFFNDVHLWMPILSKKRFHDRLNDFKSQSLTERTILLLCMKLVSWIPSEDTTNDKPRSFDYLLAKRLIIAVEISGVMTMQVLQAMILICIYEIGHAIYPAAYLTIGICARYGIALGINVQEPLNSASQLDAMAQEERKRAWWAIVILDRFENPNPSNPLKTTLIFHAWSAS